MGSGVGVGVGVHSGLVVGETALHVLTIPQSPDDSCQLYTKIVELPDPGVRVLTHLYASITRQGLSGRSSTELAEVPACDLPAHFARPCDPSQFWTV